jgi:putative addiction module component (TIGR02574 family)
MTDRAKKIFEEVLSLDADERLALVETLYDEFGPPEPGYEEACNAEIERRLNDLDSGRTKTIPWEDIRAELGLPPRGA